MKDMNKEDVLFVFQELIDNCEGATMAAKSGSYLYNFAFMLQDKLRTLKDNIECMNMVETQE